MARRDASLISPCSLQVPFRKNRQSIWFNFSFSAFRQLLLAVFVSLSTMLCENKWRHPIRVAWYYGRQPYVAQQLADWHNGNFRIFSADYWMGFAGIMLFLWIQDGFAGRFSQSALPNGREAAIDGTRAPCAQRSARIPTNCRTWRHQRPVEG